MNPPARVARALVVVGLIAMVAGAIQPLEGLLLVLSGMVFIGIPGLVGPGHHRLPGLWGFLQAALALVLREIDPVRVSMFVLPGIGVAAIGALAGDGSRRILLCCSFLLVALGVGGLWLVGAAGGSLVEQGGPTSRVLVLVPYAAGWIMGLAGAIGTLRDGFGAPSDDQGRPGWRP